MLSGAEGQRYANSPSIRSRWSIKRLLTVHHPAESHDQHQQAFQLGRPLLTAPMIELIAVASNSFDFDRLSSSNRRFVDARRRSLVHHESFFRPRATSCEMSARLDVGFDLARKCWDANRQISLNGSIERAGRLCKSRQTKRKVDQRLARSAGERRLGSAHSSFYHSKRLCRHDGSPRRPRH